MSRWGRDGPPDEAYSRVTNPERFQPLHDLALQLIEGLKTSFELGRVEGFALDPELEGMMEGSRKLALARPTVKLVPQDAQAAPLTIGFSGFPGVVVRAGHWFVEPFPSCGCDACDETGDGEAARLHQLVEDVTAGRFREAIRVPAAGDGWQEAELWSPPGSFHRRGPGRLERSLALQRMAEAGGSSFDWKPWPARDRTVPEAASC